MKVTKASIKFILREDKKKKDSTCPVYMQVNFKGREHLSLGISVLPKDWSVKKQCVKSSAPDYMLCNSIIQKALSNAIERENYYIKNSIHYTASDLVSDRIVYAFNSSFADIMSSLLAERQLSLNSQKSYKQTLNVVMEFIGDLKPSITDINSSNLNQFVRFCKVKKLKDNSIRSHLRNIRSCQNFAVSKNIIDEGRVIKQPTIKLKQESRVYYFNSSQMRLFADYLLDIPYNKYLWLFYWLFRLNGCSLVDGISLRYSNVELKKIGNGDYYVFNFKRQKTSVPVRCVISVDDSVILRFFNKYYNPSLADTDNYIFPFLEDKDEKGRIYKLNRIASISVKHLRKALEELNKRIENEKLDMPLFEVNKASLYTARHSFANIYLSSPSSSVYGLANLMARSANTISTYIHQFHTDGEVLCELKKLAF